MSQIHEEETQRFLELTMGSAGTGLTTPVAITDKIKDFAQKVAKSEPFIVPVSGIACIGRCFLNCEEYCQQFGGTPVYGWMVWESPKPVRLNAEFHSIVKKDGSYIDITRKPDKEATIVFFPDHERKAVFGNKSIETFDLVEYPKCNVRSVKHPIDSRWLEPFDFSRPYPRLP